MILRTGQPVVGIVGRCGAYGRWLERFVRERMGLEVIGRDSADDEDLSVEQLIEQADVLFFSVPIRHTVSLIGEYIRCAAGAERGKLWLDLTSIKAAPVAALLASQAEVVGLHPMSAPPKTSTLKGRPLAVCRARVARWNNWLDALFAASQADCIEVEPVQHDKIMALVQGMVHASHMAQGAVLKRLAPELGGLAVVESFRTVGYAMDSAVTRRILHGNPDIYTDIQFDNPYVAPMLEHLTDELAGLNTQVQRGDESARQVVRERWLGESAASFDAATLREGSYAFERLGYLLTDLAEPRYLSVFLPQDQPGSLRTLLSVFEAEAVNLDSIHSSRSPDGELHFRLGVGTDCDKTALQRVAVAIEAAGIGRVVDYRDSA